MKTKLYLKSHISQTITLDEKELAQLLEDVIGEKIIRVSKHKGQYVLTLRSESSMIEF